MAVCVAKNMFGEGKYTYVYDDDMDDTLLAYFTPTSAYCRDQHANQYGFFLNKIIFCINM